MRAAGKRLDLDGVQLLTPWMSAVRATTKSSGMENARRSSLTQVWKSKDLGGDGEERSDEGGNIPTIG